MESDNQKDKNKFEQGSKLPLIAPKNLPPRESQPKQNGIRSGQNSPNCKTREGYISNHVNRLELYNRQ